MGLATLPELVAGLVAAGLDPSTPAAIVEGGGTGAARRLAATLGSLPGEARGWAARRPALVLIGDVVRMGCVAPCDERGAEGWSGPSEVLAACPDESR